MTGQSRNLVSYIRTSRPPRTGSSNRRLRRPIPRKRNCAAGSAKRWNNRRRRDHEPPSYPILLVLVLVLVLDIPKKPKSRTRTNSHASNAFSIAMNRKAPCVLAAALGLALVRAAGADGLPAVGITEPFLRVELSAAVSGIITARPFKEGA